MRTKTLLKRLLRLDKIAINDIEFEEANEEEQLIIKARPMSRDSKRCPMCNRVCTGYDSPRTPRRWRSLDFGGTRVYIEAFAPRIECKTHGVLTAKVPWARHDSDYTYDFETAVTWLTLHTTAQDVAEYFRIKWHTVGSIARRVQKSLEDEQPNRFDNLVKIGIDETSYKKGHKYMTVIVNHETGHLIWARKGHGKEVLTEFFKGLSIEQRANIKYVTADGARWIADCVKDYCPNAERCIDPFHVVAWANDCLDEVRKQAVKRAKIEAVADKKAERSKKKRIQRYRNMHY